MGLLQLRQQGRLTWECQNELFRQEVEGADDIRLNAPLVSKCMSDKRTFCNDVAPGMTQTISLLAHGTLRGCLYAQIPGPFSKCIRHGVLVLYIDTKCKQVRLTHAVLCMLQSCKGCHLLGKRSKHLHLLRLIHLVCTPSVPSSGACHLLVHSDAGSARVKDCLEQHRQDDGFSSECRDELENMMQERATDFRLDSSLRDACEEDIMYTCGWDDVRPCADAAYQSVSLHAALD